MRSDSRFSTNHPEPKNAADRLCRIACRPKVCLRALQEIEFLAGAEFPELMEELDAEVDRIEENVFYPERKAR